MPITLLDGILIGFTLVSAVLAMVRGFSREILSVASWAVSAVAAYLFYKQVTPYVTPYISSKLVAEAVAAGCIFLVALIITSIITMKIADFIIDSRIGALDRTLGFAYGAARGILVVAVAVTFVTWLMANNEPKWISQAKSLPLLDGIGKKLQSMLPDDPENSLLKRLQGNSSGEKDTRLETNTSNG